MAHRCEPGKTLTPAMRDWLLARDAKNTMLEMGGGTLVVVSDPAPAKDWTTADARRVLRVPRAARRLVEDGALDLGEVVLAADHRGALPSAVSGSLRPWPVRTQTTVSGAASPSATGRPCARIPATEAAEAGSQKTPSRRGQQAVGVEDLLVGDGGDPAARRGDRRHRLLPARRVADPDRRGDGLRLLDRMAVDQRRRALGLEAVEDRVASRARRSRGARR